VFFINELLLLRRSRNFLFCGEAAIFLFCANAPNPAFRLGSVLSYLAGISEIVLPLLSLRVTLPTAQQLLGSRRALSRIRSTAFRIACSVDGAEKNTEAIWFFFAAVSLYSGILSSFVSGAWVGCCCSFSLPQLRRLVNSAARACLF
jgi:hypothetical protein